MLIVLETLGGGHLENDVITSNAQECHSGTPLILNQHPKTYQDPHKNLMKKGSFKEFDGGFSRIVRTPV
jgi:xanthine/CO dehydrogenase XdhC/CoxF family maturation factor